MFSVALSADLILLFVDYTYTSFGVPEAITRLDIFSMHLLKIGFGCDYDFRWKKCPSCVDGVLPAQCNILKLFATIILPVDPTFIAIWSEIHFIFSLSNSSDILSTTNHASPIFRSSILSDKCERSYTF